MKKIKKPEKYKYKTGEIVYYVGKIFEDLINKPATIIRRSTSRDKPQYKIQYENGLIRILEERWIRRG